MTEIKFATATDLYPISMDVIREAKNDVYGSEDVDFVPAEPGPGVLGLGVDSGVRTLSPKQMMQYPNANLYVRAALRRLQGHRHPFITDETLFLDTETHNAGRQYSMPTRDFFRLGQYAWGDGPVTLTTDYDEVMDVFERAELVVAHNLHPFDASTFYGTDSLRPLELAQEKRLFDTMVHAVLTTPAPWAYVNRAGQRLVNATLPEGTKKWLALDNLSFQMGLTGKIGNLQDIARRYNPKGTLVRDLDYGLIPVDDPDFRTYAEQDVVAVRDVFNELMWMKTPDAYDWREQLNAAIDAQNTRNGFMVDTAKAWIRRNELTARKEVIVSKLEADYGLPTEGKAPWATKIGKEAIFKALADVGITPETRPDWPLTDTGNLSLAGEALIEITAGTQAADMGQALAEVKGHRSLAALAIMFTQPDGKVHPEITALQRSGRKSTTKPGLTIWGSRDVKGGVQRTVDKEYFIPEPGHHLVSFDYSQADARMVAAYSGDEEFAKRFEEGVDAHELTGRLVYGDERYDSDPDRFRQEAKMMGHAYAYRCGPKTLAKQTKLDVSITQNFVWKMENAYWGVTAWQNECYSEGQSGWVTNAWGRRMPVDKERAYTQAPALYGQSGTRELMVDALIRMLEFDIRLITWLKAQIHDELIFSIPDSELDWAPAKIKELMDTEWRGVRFPASAGQPATNWREAGHG